MSDSTNYIDINRKSWNSKVPIHVDSAFYDVAGFKAGQSSLKEIELELLGDIKGKSVLHLQCHFGQDTISLSRLGATTTGVDLSDKAIDVAQKLAEEVGSDSTFICCDIYDLPTHLDTEFDIVFTSYGTIGWLPDIDKWAKIVSKYLKPGGKFVFAEFHPFIWMYDDDFDSVAYSYFKDAPIIETNTGTYAEKGADLVQQNITWNHSIGEVVNSLISNGLEINVLNEYDYSPYNCLNHMVELSPGKYIIEKFGNKIPMVYAILATKKG
ncbi:MAG: class I SAM-dependent methyltransferase [Saprospiraceae bacterium]|nr:class I SAM-dependent methyltransferase [Saprospiraceae bacterium]